MSNRFPNPFEQMLDGTTGDLLNGGRLFFYLTGTSTKTPTYTTSAMSVQNANPVVLDSAGRHSAIYLDPAVTYKVVLAGADSSGTDDPPTNVIATADPVVDPAANLTASFQVYNGDPNGHVAGNAGTVGSVGASVVWDYTNQRLYVCTTTGTATTAVWTQQGAILSGAIIKSGVITPTTLAANTNDYAPTSGSTASTWRIQGNAAYDITGISISQVAGQEILLENIGTFNFTLRNQNASSAAANRFLFDGDVVLGPNQSFRINYDGVALRWKAVGSANVGPLSQPGGRLTLTSGTPVLSADVTSATTIYYTPYQGFFAPLYNGTQTVMVDIGSELSLALDSNAAHTGYHQSGKNFDLFLYKDGTTLRLVSGPAWTNDTTRATALEYKNGFLCNAASMTARYDASASTVTVPQDQGLYLGTFRASADGTTLFIGAPAAAAGGGNARLYLWNAYNRVSVFALSKDSTDSWTYNTLTWRSVNNNTNNRISFVVGLAEDSFSARYSATCKNNAGSGTVVYAGVCLDATNTFSGIPGSSGANDGTNANDVQVVGYYEGIPGIGHHFFQAVEASDANATTTWYGDNGVPTFRQMGLHAILRM